MNRESFNFFFKTFILMYLLYLHWQFIKQFYTHIYHTLLVHDCVTLLYVQILFPS